MAGKSGKKVVLNGGDLLRDSLQQIGNRLSKIESKVDSLEQTNSFTVRSDPGKHEALVKKIFGKSERRAKVYLAIDGKRSVKAIAEHLNIQRQNVGKEMRVLVDEELVHLADSYSNLDIYAKNPLERSVRITKLLTTMFALLPDGRAASSKTR